MTVGVGGLLRAVRGRLLGSMVHMKVDRHDCKHPFRLRIPSSDVTTYRQVFIKREYEFNLKNTPEIIVDAGANIGLASIYFANKYPQAKIIAIEPEQSNFELLKENAAPYANIIPVQAAVWHKNEEVNLIDPGLGKWGFMTEAMHTLECHSGEACHTVMGMTIDKIVQDYDLERINILKVDIEGAEKEVFSDASSWLEKVDSIVIELHECMKPGCIQSFQTGTHGFDSEWRQGERVYLSRGAYLSQGSP